MRAKKLLILSIKSLYLFTFRSYGDVCPYLKQQSLRGFAVLYVKILCLLNELLISCGINGSRSSTALVTTGKWLTRQALDNKNSHLYN